MVEPLVKIQELCKGFPGVQALQNAQFELFPGEVHALVGENGAGKSTLMKVLAGIYRKDSGTVLYKGKEIDLRGPRDAQCLGIGIIHQELNLMGHLSVAQNIFIGREPRKKPSFIVDDKLMNSMAKELISRLHVDLDPRSKSRDLTVAKQQMVEIVKALSYNSQVLIMDEPTAALNEAEIQDLFTIIRQLKKEKVGIVYISHRMDELKQISDRITIMRDGAYIDTFPTQTADIDKVISLMVGRQLFHTFVAKQDKSAPKGTKEEVLVVQRINRGRFVKNASFVLHRGEILGLAGLMGAGRTELARAIFGADPIDSGEIFVSGKKVIIKSPADAVRQGIGYLSEDRKRFGLAVGLDVEVNVALASLQKFLRWFGVINAKYLKKAAKEYITSLNIKTPSQQQLVKFLSGGNQQKVVVAKWLMRDCKILFFDEPTRGIDVGAKSEIYKLLNELARQGKAIVMISSELPEIIRMSHRILVMCEGRITGELDAGEATQEKIMQLATQRES